MIIITKLLDLIKLQLFLTVVSLPILFWWGLPVSLMSIIGNILFTPFLTIFLLLSTILFITELFFIPNYIIILLVEKIAEIWLVFINLGSPKWLLFLEKTPKLINIITVLLLLILFFIILFFFYKKKFRNIQIVFIPIITIFIYIGFISKTEISKITDNNKLIIDKSFEIKRKNLTGFNQIICIVKPSIKILNYLTFLCSQIENGEVVFKAWQPSRLKKSGWKAWENLLYIIKKNNIKLSILK